MTRPWSGLPGGPARIGLRAPGLRCGSGRRRAGRRGGSREGAPGRQGDQRHSDGLDPELVVLGGGIGQAPGFAEAVDAEHRQFAPVLPAVRLSALGTDAVVDGAAWPRGELAWNRLSALLPAPPADGG